MLTQPYRPVAYRTEHGYAGMEHIPTQINNYISSTIRPANLSNTRTTDLSLHQKLQNNLGKNGMFYMIPGREVMHSDYRGLLEATGEDHIVIRDLNTGLRHVLPLTSLDYAVFIEPTGAYTHISGQMPSIHAPSSRM